MSVRITVEYTCSAPGCFEKASATSNKEAGLRERLWGELEAAGWVISVDDGRHYCAEHYNYPEKVTPQNFMESRMLAKLDLDVARHREHMSGNDEAIAKLGQRDCSRDK